MSHTPMFFYKTKQSVLSKLSAFVLAFLMLISPLAPAFAQDASGASTDSSSQTSGLSTDTTTNSTGTDTTTSSSTTDSGIGSTGSSLTTGTTSSTATPSTPSTFTPSTGFVDPFGNPLASGNTNEVKHLNTKIDQLTGALSYSYTFDVPPGRNGMTPDVSLSYNSQSVDNQSIFGLGWESSIPYITRTNKHGTDQLYTEAFPTFTSSISGELTQLTSTGGMTHPEYGTYAAKVESGDFLQYAYNAGVWTVTDKNGTVQTFGATAGERQDDPSLSSDIYKWMLSKTIDTNNNYISYTYFKNAGQIYPDTITYTSNGSSTGIFEIDFIHTARTDTIDGRVPAFSVAPNYLITEVDAKVSGSWVKKYVLAYSGNTNGAQALLTSITESGKDSLGVVTTLPAETFDYNQATSHTWNYSTSWPFPADAATGGTTPVIMNTVPASLGTAMMADLNGDGLPDLIESSRSVGGSTASETENVYLNNGAGWMLDPSWSFPNDVATIGTGITLSGGGTPHVVLKGDAATAELVDVNGDGLPDLVQSWYIGGVEDENIYLNTGSGWVLDTSWTFPIDAAGTGTSHVVLNNNPVGEGTATLVDVNGDGLPDLVQSWQNNATSTVTEIENVYLNTGSGWVLAPGWSFPLDAASSILGTTLSGGGTPHVALNYTTNGVGNATLFDVNGDGLPDLVQSWHSPGGSGILNEINNVYINTGNGWALDPSWTFPTDPIAASSGFTLPGGGAVHIGLNNTGFTVTPVDVNGDGLIDLVQSWHYDSSPGTQIEYDNVYINNGTTWVLDPTWTFPTDVASSDVISGTSTPVHVGFNRDGLPVQAYDVNGDGLPDLVQSWLSGSTYTNNVYINTGPLPLLSKITTPEGGTEQMTYKQISASGANNNMWQPLMVVASTTTTDPVLGTSGTDSYTYNGGTYEYVNPFDKKFAGFTMSQKTDAAGNVTKTYYHTGNGTDTTHGEYSDMGAKIGQPYRVEQYDNSGHLYTVAINKWDDYSIGSDHDFVKLDRTTTLTYDGTGSHRDTAIEYQYNNTNGNLLQTVNWGEVTGADDGSFTDIGTDKSTENITYATPAIGSSVTGAPSDDIVLDQSGTTVRETRTYYDGLALGSVTIGNATKTEKWKSGGTFVNTQKTYDPTYGIVLTSKDEDGNTTTYTPDVNNLYQATVTDALTYTKNYVYNYAVGKPTQITDENGFVYNTNFDGLGRVVSEYIPDPSSGTSVIKTAYAYTDTSGAVSVHETDYLDGTTMVDTYSYYDGLGRVIQTRKSSEVSGTFNVTDVAYNTLGEKLQESLPYASSGSARTTATSTTALYTTYAYDAVGRTTSSTNAVGTTSNAYSLWKTTVTDPASKVKVYYKDAYNNLVQVDEHNGSSIYSTYYLWNLNGKLLRITDANGNIRNFTYDGLGSRLSAEDLHNPVAVAIAVWNYMYDPAGNMTQSVSPNANTVNYTYDGLNRELTETWTGGTGTDITYGYDTCTNGITKLCTVTMLSGANTNYTYDADGNIASEAKTIGTTPFLTSYIHDRQGNLTLLTYPDAAQASYLYNNGGLIEKIQRKESGGSFTDVVSNFDYSPIGQPAIINYANGVTTTNTYDAAHLYRLSNKVTTNTVPTNLQDTAYTYDSDGNITNLVDTSATDGAKTVAYTYDDLNRLHSATATGVPTGTTPYTQTYTYDPIGNIVNGPAGAYTYLQVLYVGGTTTYSNYYGGSYEDDPDAVTSVGGVGITYDNDGNVLTHTATHGAYKYVWNYKDQPTTIYFNPGANLMTYQYDYDGSRVSGTVSGPLISSSTAYYPNKYYTVDGSGDYIKDIYAGNELVATITTTDMTVVTPQYVHTDDILGSNVVTDASGAQVQLLDYFPFGGDRLNEQTGTFDEQKQYGGHYFDEGTQLSYLGARYYSPAFGRFVSEDPSFLAVGDEQILQVIGTSLNDILTDPQLLNSYAYARENPITKIDPNGQMSEDTRAGLLYMYDNNALWRGMIDHPILGGFGVGIVGGLSAMGGAEALPSIAKAVSAASANPAVQSAVVRGALGAGTSMSAKALGNEASGQTSSFGSYAFNGATGFVAGAMGMKTGPIGAGILGGVVNAVNQMEENGTRNVSGSSIGISAVASSLTAGTMSNIPTNAIGEFGKIFAESAVGWSVETPAQIINTGLRK